MAETNTQAMVNALLGQQAEPEAAADPNPWLKALNAASAPPPFSFEPGSPQQGPLPFKASNLIGELPAMKPIPAMETPKLDPLNDTPLAEIQKMQDHKLAEQVKQALGKFKQTMQQHPRISGIMPELRK